MKTMVHILDSNSNGSLSCLFDDDTRFNIISLNDGVLAIEPYSETSIDTFAKKVFGCFQKGSTFSGIKTIEFVFLTASHYLFPIMFLALSRLSSFIEHIL